jgi:protein associated with RNAse G/E
MTAFEPTGERVRVLSTKYDGSPHNDYFAYRLPPLEGTEDGAPLRLYVPPGTVMRSPVRPDFQIVTPFTHLFWPGADVWWNVEHMLWPHVGQHLGAMLSYANITTPARVEDDTVHWVDLDLDVVITPGGPILVDEEEFEEHRVRFGYPDGLVTRARAAAGELLALAAQGAPPWDRDAHIEGLPERPDTASPLPRGAGEG